MSFGRAVVAGLSVRRVLMVELVALVLLIQQWIGFDEADRYGRYTVDISVSYCTSALLFLIATLCAEEAVRRGMRVRVAFPVALVCASVLGSLIWTMLWFDLSWRRERSVVLFVVENTTQLGRWGALGMFVYCNRVSAERVLQHVRQAQMKRVRVERDLIRARLEAARAQIDAPALFAELASIRDSLRRNEPQAAVALDDLTQRLRASRARALEVGDEGHSS